MDQRSLHSIAELFQRERRALIEAINGDNQPEGHVEETMEYRVKESEEHRGAYVVASTEAKLGETLSVLFSGPDAKRHAEEYVVWKNSRQEVTEEQLLRR